MTEQFIRFVLVGLVNTFAGLSVIFALKYLAQSGDVVANGVGYLVGLTVSFILNRSWTFRHRGRIGPAILRFALVFLVAYGFNLATVLMLIHRLGVNTYFAQAAGLPPYMIVFFLLSKFFAFRDDTLARPRAKVPFRQ